MFGVKIFNKELLSFCCINADVGGFTNRKNPNRKIKYKFITSTNDRINPIEYLNIFFTKTFPKIYESKLLKLCNFK